MLTFRPTIKYDVYVVASKMREADVEEVFAASGLSPLDGLEKCVEGSDEAITILLNDSPIAIFGYKVTEANLCGLVWMLGSDDVFNCKIEFLKKSRFWVNYIQTKVPLIYNLVYHKNIVHIKWMEWLGFRFVRTLEKAGHLNLPFIEFVRLRNV